MRRRPGWRRRRQRRWLAVVVVVATSAAAFLALARVLAVGREGGRPAAGARSAAAAAAHDAAGPAHHDGEPAHHEGVDPPGVAATWTASPGGVVARESAGVPSPPAPARRGAQRGPRMLRVGAQGSYRTIAGALAAAAAGDTVRVGAGVYREHVVAEVPVVLIGERGAAVDGGDSGVVVTVRAPGTVVADLVIRGSGRSLSREDAGILVSGADGTRIERCRLEDVLFGVYVKRSADVVVQANEILGKALPVSLRGDGIRLWYSRRGRIENNRVERTRDVVIWFSEGVVVRGNRVVGGRYGLHYMYSDRGEFEDNTFAGNRVGAFLMYSAGIAFRRNMFAEAAGATGIGLGLKDADAIVAESNVMVKNAVGVYLDNSPRSEAMANRFVDNIIAFNEVGVSLLPSVHSNGFVENVFVGNVRAVEVSGGGTALANGWRGNYWDDYVGFDGDDDGHGDTPFVLERLSDDLLAKRPALRVYELSPAMLVLNTLARVFPLLQPEAVVVDSLPRLGWEREGRTGSAAGGRTEGQRRSRRGLTPAVARASVPAASVAVEGVSHAVPARVSRGVGAALAHAGRGERR